MHVCDVLGQSGYHSQYIAYLQPTSPLRHADDILATLELVRQKSFESAASFVLADPHPDRAFVLKEDGAAEPVIGHDAVWVARQARDPRYHRTGAVYILNTDMLRTDRTNRMLHGRVGAHIMPHDRSVDIDTLVDLRLCEALVTDMNCAVPSKLSGAASMHAEHSTRLEGTTKTKTDGYSE